MITTNKMGIKWVPTQVCLNFTFGKELIRFNIRGSKVIPSRYITKRKEVNTTKVPASGCNRMSTIGIRIIEKAIKTSRLF
jgi:hypothetical protein